MTKARILANLISDSAELADGQISVAEVVGAAPLASPTFTGNIDAGDNVKIRLGDSDDLEISSNGTTGIIRTGNSSSDIRLESDNRIVICDRAFNETFAVFNDDGDVKLYHNDAEKLATTATGIDVTGTATSDALDLTAIAKDISDTAVDVFVYDTSKDSDGGAWRKRTQNTSWYNETLNTATRGSRREFPAVAAAMMMQNQGKTSHAAPRSGGDTALAWANVIVPSTVQAAGIAVNGLVARTQSNNNKDVAIVNSDNTTAVAVDTNSTMATIAEVTIVNPEVVTSTNTANTNTVVCLTDADYSCE